MHAPGAGDHEAARHDLIAGVLHDRLGFACQQRFVYLEPLRGEHDSVDHELVTDLQFEHVIDHDITGVDRHRLTVPLRANMRCRHDSEAVERPLGTPLLRDANRRVAQQDAAEHRVLQWADHDDDDEHRAEKCVEPGKDICPDDLSERPTRRRNADVG